MNRIVRKISLPFALVIAILYSINGICQYQYSGNSHSTNNLSSYNYSGNSYNPKFESSGNFTGGLTIFGEPIQPPHRDIYVYADDVDPGCDTLDPSCPIDSGVWLLLIIGLGYGFIQLKRKRKISIKQSL